MEYLVLYPKVLSISSLADFHRHIVNMLKKRDAQWLLETTKALKQDLSFYINGKYYTDYLKDYIEIVLPDFVPGMDKKGPILRHLVNALDCLLYREVFRAVTVASLGLRMVMAHTRPIIREWGTSHWVKEVYRAQIVSKFCYPVIIEMEDAYPVDFLKEAIYRDLGAGYYMDWVPYLECDSMHRPISTKALT